MRKYKSRKFYRFQYCTDTKITGPTFPQCTGTIKTVSCASDRGLYAFFKSVIEEWKLPDSPPHLGGIRAPAKTKMTDCISTAALMYFPIVNRRMLDSMKHLNFGIHAVYPMRVYHKNIPYLYFCIPVIKFDRDKTVVWEKCKFYEATWRFKTSDLDSIYDERLDTVVPCFKSTNDYFSYENFFDLRLERLAVNDTIPCDLDYITLNCFGVPLLSERLAKVYHKNSLTGLEFNEENAIEIVWYR